MKNDSRRLALKFGLSAAAALANPVTARASDTVSTSDLLIAEDAKINADDLANQNRALNVQSSESQGGRLLPSIKVLTGTDDSTAQLTFSTHSERASSFSSDDFALTFSAPISETKKRAEFLTQDGLPDQVSAGFTFTHSFVNLDGVRWKNGRIAALSLEAQQACLSSTKNADLSASARQEKCESMDSRQIGAAYLSEDKQAELLDLFNKPTDEVAKRTYTILTVSGNIGTQKFDYFDPLNLAAKSDRKTALSLGAWFGVLPQLKSPVFLVVGFEAKRNYTADDDATYCPASTGSAPVKCTTGAFAPPSEEIDYKLSGKVRFTTQIGHEGSKTPFGIEVSASYDLHDNTWGVQVPVYVFIDKDNGLTGGFRGAYDSKKDKFTASVFIGKTFDFLKIG